MSSGIRTGMSAVTLVALILLSGCGGSTEDPPPDTGSDEDTPSEPSEDGGAGADDGGAETGDLDVETAEARAILAEELGTDEEAEVVVAERVTWPDAALGCPQPDQMYTQALVEGYRIVLTVDGDEIAFHGAEGEPPFRCDDPAPAEG